MKRSTDRILTTHAGSLPRPEALLPLIREKAANHAVDETGFGARVKAAVADMDLMGACGITPSCRTSGPSSLCR